MKALVVLLAIGVAGCGSGQSVDPNTGLPQGAEPTTSNNAGVGDSSDEPAPTTSKAAPYAFDGHGANVSQKRFGRSWPLTLKSGRVNCVVDQSTKQVSVVFTADDNKRYALNGTAKSQAATWGYLPVDPIWADDPGTGLKKDIGVLIDICSPLMQ